jgi:tetratricopeptide (TPR) repeat protein
MAPESGAGCVQGRSVGLAVTRSHVPQNAGAADPGAGFADAKSPSRFIRPLRHPRLKEAAAALRDDRIETAEHTLVEFLEKHPENVDGLYLLAETLVRLGRIEDAEVPLARCIERAPEFDAARFAYAKALHQQGKFSLSEVHIEILVHNDPLNTRYRDLQTVVLTALGKHAEALACYGKLSEDSPGSGEIQIRYGHALRTMGLREECISVYRKVIGSFPARGDAYWSLASLDAFRLTSAEVNSMQALLARSDLTSENRVYVHFALGRALGNLAQWEKSFENFAKGNAIRRMDVVYDPDNTTERILGVRKLFTPAWFDALAGARCASPEPIFVLGMQRSGSTLVEQILASHPAIEGMGELPEFPQLAARPESRSNPNSEYRNKFDTDDPFVLQRLGERYLDKMRCRRKSARPFFTDKQPYNFWHIGHIHLALPNARIVDVRRHPMACCFSNFATLLGHGQGFTHRLGDLGRYYRDYVDAMAHFDRVLPRKIHRVCYERLVAEPETEIRRLLEYLKLPFEEGCLRFYDNRRAFDSASNEQVRMSIFTDGVGRWRNYEPWLGPLKEALGPALESWNEAWPFES